MSLVRIEWRPGKKALRRFGVTMLVGLAAVGLAVHLLGGHPRAGMALYAAAVVIGGLGLTGTRAALPAYWIWMGLAFMLGNVTSRVVLAALYYGLVTPMGLVMRVAGEDRLRLSRPKPGSLWVDVEPGRGEPRHERQF